MYRQEDKISREFKIQSNIHILDNKEWSELQVH